ncbi:MAG: hypothetical protein AAGC78_10320 [Cellvibrio sp.]|uniref:hypothetical protein n=1 Tax=Cellvibrio sp. TaxID=1965322 RepID=UPI0031B15C57
MNKLAILLTATLISGCSTVDTMRYGEKASTPIPTEEFTAVGNYSHRNGSIQVATEQAEAFCKRWRAAPAIISQETKTTTDAPRESFGKGVARSLKSAVTGEGSAKDYYETTIKYKCL